MLKRSEGAVLLAAWLAGTFSNGCSDSTRDEPADAGAFDVTAEPKDDGAMHDGPSTDEPTVDATSDRRLPDAPAPDVKADDPLPDVPAPDTLADTPFDREVDGADGATCTVEPVWSADSASLRVTTSGGFLPNPRGCRPNAPEIYEFFPATQSLTRVGCVLLGQIVHQVVHLTAVENSRLLAEVSALRTTCRMHCSIDAPTQKLTVSDGSGCIRRAYEGNIYAACGSTSALPPYIEQGALVGSFQAAVDAACNPDGGAPDVGTCDTSDGGSSLVCRPETPTRDVVSDMPVDSPPSDADFDAGADGGDGPICSPQPFWSDRSVSFKVTRSGGLPPPQPIDAGCGTQPWNYEFSLPLKTLTEWGCINGQKGLRELALNDEQISTIVATMRGLRSTCRGTCGPLDAPDVSLVVRDCADFIEYDLQSNFYADCPGKVPRPPYLDFDDFFAVQNLFGGMFATACSGVDAGAGTCRPVCRQ